MARVPAPGQYGGTRADAAAWRRPPVEPATSEACRFLCAGVHLDSNYRAAVFDELYVHEERFTAPSFGIDAARVLAHALHARRLELAWGLGVLLFWIVSSLLTEGLFLLLALPCLLLTAAPALRRRAGETPQASAARASLGTAVRWYGRIMLAIVLVVLAELATGSADGAISGALTWLPGVEALHSLTESDTDVYGSGVEVSDTLQRHAWLSLGLFLLPLPLAVGLRRGQFARLMRGPLSAERFPNVAADPAELTLGNRAERSKHVIRREQHAPLIMYHTENPFRGAGGAIEPWTLAVELRPRKDRTPEPVDNGTILDTIHRLVGDLQIPSAKYAAPDDATGVRDRLRELHIDECVFLPADGIPARYGAPYDPAEFEGHRVAAVEEGGETRRHFLRIRVGGWEEELVTTVFVRVHTQGGMLMLEIAPHVLLPVDRRFREADRLAYEYAHANAFGKIFWALVHTPWTAGQCVVTLGRHLKSVKELSASGHRRALPDGPAVSVRERGSDPDVSLFQEMDVMRYLRSIQDRVADGVKVSLYEAGWQTAEFEQKVVNVRGGVYVDSANNSAFAFGAHSTVTTHNTRGTSGSTGANHGSS
ncbi:hypothetical protein [Streptomyces armeniacus]|uniref:hypothetical protein n=1 Tax=Streptomyces armeniacus TaxID=83291 RepID=UPI001FEB38B2|nr:hypothetical protein [Streptomyces armeniacus]